MSSIIVTGNGICLDNRSKKSKKQGLSYVLMNSIIEDIEKNHQVNKAKLGAQTYAIPFYEKLGFMVCSNEYLDAGIPHKDMQLKFK